MCVCNMKTIHQTLSRYRPETKLIIRHQLKSIIGPESKVKNEVKGHNPQKAHPQPLRDENNPANGFRDIVRKRNTDA